MNTCVITLDCINEICHPDGKLARFSDRISKHHTIEHANRVLKWGRANNDIIVHVKVGFRHDYLDSSEISPLFKNAKKFGALNVNEWGCQFCSELDRQDDDIVITKHRVSALYATDLEVILRANQVQHVILMGVATNNAVELTGRELHDRDYRVSIVKDAVETVNDEEQNYSLSFLSRIAEVLTSEDLIK